jgi:hypothetical protein
MVMGKGLARGFKGTRAAGQQLKDSSVDNEALEAGLESRLAW